MLKPMFIMGAALALAMPGAAIAKGNNGQGNHGQHGAGSHDHGTQAHNKDQRGKRTGRAAACPPGLQKKNPGCLPPGQWKKGDRLPESWVGQYIRYGQLPDSFRRRYGDDPTNRYIYRDNRVFVVDAASRVIETVFGP